MRELTPAELAAVSGAVDDDTAYSASVGVAAVLLGLGVTVTAPAWLPAALLGGSIAASGTAIYYAICN